MQPSTPESKFLQYSHQGKNVLTSAEMDEYKELFPHDECLDGTSSLFPTDSIGSYVESPYQRIQGFSYTNPIYDDLVIQNDCN